MYICSCHAVTDHAIRNAVKSGTKTLAQLAKQTGVATRCGICGREAKRLFYEALRAETAASEDRDAPAEKYCATACGASPECKGCPALDSSPRDESETSS